LTPPAWNLTPRCWPHTDLRRGMPNDADLLDLLGTWVDDTAMRNAILVANPAALYGAGF
jgi:predicted TIM-barrel fold metal-dependent hydrolase